MSVEVKGNTAPQADRWRQIVNKNVLDVCMAEKAAFDEAKKGKNDLFVGVVREPFWHPSQSGSSGQLW